MHSDALFQSLINNSQEYFEINNVDYMQSNGIATTISKLPTCFSNLISKALEKDLNALKGLKKIGIFGEYEKIFKYYRCNYSLYDGKSDVLRDGHLGDREFISCPDRNNCKAEGLLCKLPGNLTKRQIQIAVKITYGHSDTQICDELFISQNTLRRHKNNIEEKIGVKGKTSIGVWAVKNKLI